jgi:hypothetical protein
MRLYKQVFFAYSKKDSAFSLVEKVKNLFSEFGIKESGILFYLSDHYSFKKSSVSKVVKNYPSMGDFEFENNPEKLHALSNLSSIWQEANPNKKYDNIDLNVIEEIAKGIPRVYPFDRSTYIFDRIDWYGNGVINDNITLYKTVEDIKYSKLYSFQQLLHLLLQMDSRRYIHPHQ